MPSLPSDMAGVVLAQASALTSAWVQKQGTGLTPLEVAAAYKTILAELFKGCGKVRGTEENGA